MSYSFESRVRYSEVGENGLLTLPGILNYFQDCSTFHSESVGLGINVLKGRKRLWVLSAWQVLVNRYPHLGEDIVTSTWAYAFRGFMGMRNFVMDTGEGERLAYANTFWTYINAETGLPVKLEDRDTKGYGLDEKLQMEYAPRKILLPEERRQEEAFSVQKYHLDTNHHVNNCQYIRMAADFLPADFRIRQMRAEYKQQAKLHDIICPEISQKDDKVTVLLNDKNEKPYAVAEFVKF